MSAIQGTNISAMVAPFDTADTYPTHSAQYGLGGFRSVDTAAARDAIPAQRRVEGMRVRVVNDPVLANNTDWEYVAGAWILAPSGLFAAAALQSANTATAQATSATASAQTASSQASTATTQAATAAAQATTATTQATNAASSSVTAATAQVTATAQAVTATTQSTIAQTSAGLAATAAAASQAARDAANAVGKVFTSTALGISGTTSGQSFSVLSTDGLDLIIYTNASGAATEMFRFRTKSFLDAVFITGFTASRVGYLYAWLDTAGNLLLGIKLDGNLWSGTQNITAGAAAGSAALKLATASVFAVSTVVPGPTRSRFLQAFTDANNAVVGGFLNDGTLEVKGVNLSAVATSVSALIPLTNSPKPIYAWGDSLTENGTVATGWCVLLAASLGRGINARGLGGQNAPKIIGRQGSYLVTVVVSGNQIPANGPVNVTVSNPILDSSGTIISVLGTINGIAGTLSRSGTQYVFTRTLPGNTFIVWPGTSLEISVVPDAKYCANIIWVGRNHFNYGQPGDLPALYDAQIAIVQDAIGKAIRSLNPINPKFMVVGVTTGSTEPTGTNRNAAILSCNAQTQDKYPSQFLDLNTVLLNSGTGTGQDAVDYANGVVPTSLRSDTQHLSDAGQLVVKTAFQAKLSYLGI